MPELEQLENMIRTYKLEKDAKRRQVLYLKMVEKETQF